MKKEKNAFLDLFFNRQIISYLLQTLNSVFFSSGKLANEQNIKKLKHKITLLEEKLRIFEKEIRNLKISQEKFLKKLEIIFIVICINLLIITFLIFILLLKFLLK